MKFTEECFATHMRNISGNAIRDILNLLKVPGMISFAGGNPSNSALEPDVVREISQSVLTKYGTQILQYGSTEGFAPFRESAAEFLKSDGVNCSADTVLPVQGGSQAFDLLLKALINPGDVVLCESPTFLGAIQTMREYNAKLVSVPTDEGGMIVEEAEKLIQKYHPKLMYVIPSFQNPTGITLAADRRPKLAALAEKYGMVIAEDDPYRDLRFEGAPLPPIQAYDESGWVVYMSSFSKFISPGLRVGVAALNNPLLMRKMVIGKQSVDVHSPTITQAIVDEYLRRGLLPGHLKRISAGYRTQLNAMLEAFDTFPAGIQHTVPQGGLFIWAELPEGIDAMKVFHRAVKAGVAFVPGTYFYPDDGHENTLRMNFSMNEPAAIQEGMRRLKGAIEEEMQ